MINNVAEVLIYTYFLIYCVLESVHNLIIGRGCHWKEI
jgi:hypothetical protein